MNLPLVTPSLLVAAGAAPANAALYAPHLAASCAKRGVVTPSDTANLLAEIMNESGNLSAGHECMTYTTASRIRSVFPSHFRNTASAGGGVGHALVHGAENAGLVHDLREQVGGGGG